jgi:hypothetical protein
MATNPQLTIPTEPVGLFQFISAVLAVPEEGKPLPEKRRWILPCPDEKAEADFSGGDLNMWKARFVSCPPPCRPLGSVLFSAAGTGAESSTQSSAESKAAPSTGRKATVEQER